MGIPEHFQGYMPHHQNCSRIPIPFWGKKYKRSHKKLFIKKFFS